MAATATAAAATVAAVMDEAGQMRRWCWSRRDDWCELFRCQHDDADIQMNRTRHNMSCPIQYIYTPPLSVANTVTRSHELRWCRLACSYSRDSSAIQIDT